MIATTLLSGLTLAACLFKKWNQEEIIEVIEEPQPPVQLNKKGINIRRWVCVAGSINNLKIQKSRIYYDDLKDGQVIVKVKSIGMNFADIFAILGLYGATPKGQFTPGLEFSGEVVAIHPSVTKYQIGDKIMGTTRFGAYTDYIVANTMYIRPLPEGWSFEQGASFVCQGLTAWYGLVELGNLQTLCERRKANNQIAPVLVHSAAGGVGLLSIHILEHFGAKTIATVSSKNKAEFLQKECGLAPEQVIVRTTGAEFASQLEKSLKYLKSLSPGSSGKLDIAFDSLSGDYFSAGYNSLAPGGKLVIYGAGSMMPSGARPNWLKLAYQYLKRPIVDPLEIVGQNRGVIGFNLIWLYEDLSILSPLLDGMMAIPWKAPHVCKSFEFLQTKDAIRYFQTGQNIGKVVINVNDHEQ